ncbi:MAG: nucleoside triphosphate pyrophosphohydrolase [Oscillospiraceae bacterium]|nr:nucleoside triphosphate pyrophosphohydrolase [Oscillospiraceae bacterium]
MTEQFSLKNRYGYEDLLRIMEILRGPDGCPWDREQTHESIRKNFIEETYEVAEAIDSGDKALLREELGDVLLQVVFHARMEEENGGFSMEDVCDGICQKLILRHPHIFGDVKAENSEQVLKNWDAIKKKEKHQETAADTLESVPKLLPALMRAAKVQQRAARAGFDYDGLEGAVGDLKSECAELETAIAAEPAQAQAEELGDLLFAAVNVSRFLHADAEEALTRATEKFTARFRRVEQLALSRGMDMQAVSMQELDALWREAKKMH